jgi:transcriptional regulator of arginine metabolism
MSTAQARRLALRQLLLAGQAGSQTELCDALSRQGHAATQSTVSRDLKMLGAQRVLRDDGNYAYHLRAGAPGPFPADMILAVDHNEVMLVIRTKVGRAQAVGFDLDAMKHPGVMGTLAGDDTVLVIPSSVEQTHQLADEIRELAGLVG